MYCDLIFTGKTFNGKKNYRCETCGLEAGLEDPNTKILCFSKTLDSYKSEYAEIRFQEQAKEENKQSDLADIEQEILREQQNNVENINQDMASKEEIDKRIAICNACEYYKDDSCMLCGCRVVREKNYQNKLANKNASCPDGRWGPINT